MNTSSSHNSELSNAAEFSVSEISHAIKGTLEKTFGQIRVRGELSKVVIARSGHIYTDLKDEDSVINAVCWRGQASHLKVQPEEGLEVICTGRITTYAPRSNYQLIIEQMELAGEGALLKMLEMRRKKLAEEGLFDQDRKKPLPFIPQRIGVVTSPTGAVIRDIIHRLEDRFMRPVLVWPANVQGAQAAGDIVAGVNGFNQLPDDLRPDLIIVARGGGSLEDLMPFNEESVVRAVADSDIPVISAVGHETDTTLCDLVADRRAPTPTAAAEIAVPVRSELLGSVQDYGRRLQQSLAYRLQRYKEKVDALNRALGDPSRSLEPLIQRSDNLSQRLDRALLNVVQNARHTLDNRTARLTPALLTQPLKQKQNRLEDRSRLLNSLSYQSVLERGFALVRDTDGKPAKRAVDLTSGSEITITFHDDDVTAQVK